MAGMGSFDLSGLEELRDQLEKLQKSQDQFAEECAKELAARLLAKVIKRTPVGDYSGNSYTCAGGQGHTGSKVDGKVGGTLRRGWTSQKGAGAEGLATRGAAQFVNTMNINHFGDTYVIEIVNPVEYASYVEFGHRTANHKGWVKGHFMMTISEDEIRQAAPGILKKKMQKFIGDAFR